MSRINSHYADIDLDFIPHPTTKDVVIKIGTDAIKRAVRNLVLTNFYERKFQSYIGSQAQGILFDQVSAMTAQALRQAIIEVIRNYEPRVALVDVQVAVSDERNGYNATIAAIEVNRSQPLTINLFLTRIR